MIEYNQKQSKEIYKALADSKVDLMEYFLGPDPKKTAYYKRVESRDSEEGEAGRPKGNPPIVATYSHSWNKHLYKFFNPLLKWSNTTQSNQKKFTTL